MMASVRRGLLLTVLCSGCGVMAMKGWVPVDTGETVQAPVLIAQLQLVPNVEQGKFFTIEAQKNTVKGVMAFWASADRQPIDWDAENDRGWSRIFFGSPANEFISLKKSGVSVVPWREGVGYIRKGVYALRDYCSAAKTGVQGGCRAISQDSIDMYRDIRIEVPAGASAVYIGKLVVQHNGSMATAVSVVDDYDGAMAVLRNQRIAGLNLKSVRKNLAVVLGRSR